MSKAFYQSSLFLRTISAVVLAPVFIGVMIVGDWPLIVLLLLALGVSIFEWYKLSIRTPLFVPAMVMGVIYMIISYSCFFALREVFSLNVLLIFIGMIWVSDTGAYITGKILGGPKLIRRISPNKTWSGFIGAMIFPALFAMIWVAFFGFYEDFADNKWFVPKFAAFVLGAVMGSVGQAGDLLISFMKRQASVKDTGALIPGHGGILDRIDSMLLGAPVFLVVLTLLTYVF